MARPRKQTVDYFPHYCQHKKTMFILEQRYGNDGYAFWFKLLELLGSTEEHYLDLNDATTWEFLQAKTRMGNGSCTEILDLLAKLGAIDAELWGAKVVWCQNFVDGLEPVYRNRRVETPTRPSFYIQKPQEVEVSTKKTPQSRVEESRDNTLSTSEKVDPPSLDVAPETKKPKETPKATSTDTPYQDIVDLYLAECPSLPRVRVITNKRKQQMRARWKRYPDIKTFREVFIKAELSDFLSGRSGKWTSCNFDWLLNENNMVKVLEGNYDNRDPTLKKPPPGYLTVADIRKKRGGSAGGSKPTAQGP